MITSLSRLSPLAEDGATRALADIARRIHIEGSVGNGKTSGGVPSVRGLAGRKGDEK